MTRDFVSGHREIDAEDQARAGSATLEPIEVPIGGETYMATPPTLARFTKLLADTNEKDWRTVLRATFELMDKVLEPGAVMEIEAKLDEDDAVIRDIIAAFEKLVREWAPGMNARAKALGLEEVVTQPNRRQRRAADAQARRS
jgi:hypothetical protein